MIATYPLGSVFLKTTVKKVDPKQTLRKLKEDDIGRLDSDQAQLDAFGSPEGEEDSYHLSRMIYTL